MSILQRRYTRVPEGMLIEPSLRYVEETLQDLDLDPTSKGVSTPGSAKGPLGQRHGREDVGCYASEDVRVVCHAPGLSCSGPC